MFRPSSSDAAAPGARRVSLALTDAWRRALVLSMFLGLSFALGGCRGMRDRLTDVEVTYAFENVHRPYDQQRIAGLIERIAKGPVVQSGSAVNPVYRFTVRDLEHLNAIHPRLVYRRPARPRAPEQVFNFREPKLSARFTSVELSGELEMVLRLRVSPGARLFVKGGPVEREVTQMIDSTGEVSTPIRIGRGQQAVYARTVVGSVQRYLRIDIYSQFASEVTAREYHAAR